MRSIFLRLAVVAPSLLTSAGAAAQQLPPQPTPPASASPQPPAQPAGSAPAASALPPAPPPPPAGGAPPQGQWGAPPPWYPPQPGYPYYYPPPGETEPAPQPRNSVAMMVTGIVATSVGGILTPMGVVVFASADRELVCEPDIGCHSQSDDAGKVGGTVMIVGGVVLVAVGIPMLVIGARRKKPDEAFVPRLQLGTQSGTLSMKF